MKYLLYIILLLSLEVGAQTKVKTRCNFDLNDKPKLDTLKLAFSDISFASDDYYYPIEKYPKTFKQIEEEKQAAIIVKLYDEYVCNNKDSIEVFIPCPEGRFSCLVAHGTKKVPVSPSFEKFIEYLRKKQ